MKSVVALALPRLSFSTPKPSRMLATGLTNPMASSTRSALSTCSLPATSIIFPSFHSTRTVFRPVTLPFSPMNFLVAGAGAQLVRPVWPGQRLVLLLRRLRQQLELRHAQRTLAVAGAHAIGTRIAPANDDHMLAVGADLTLDPLA